MSNSLPGSKPDPMAREVDRLLAQLENSGPRAAHDHDTSRANGGPRHGAPRKARTVVLSAHGPSRRQLVALWGELVLVIALGGAITQWPYPHRCDLPLVGYLGAVATIALGAGWTALSSWRLRTGGAHLLALMLVAWGLVLAAGQVLPRVGYAAERASWRCPDQNSIR
jgi:hypothetical protein